LRLTFSNFDGFEYREKLKGKLKKKFYKGISFGEKDFLEVWSPLAALSKTGLKSEDPWFRDLSNVTVGCTLQSTKDVLRECRLKKIPTVALIWECMYWVSTRGAALSCLMNPTDEHPQGLPTKHFEIHEKSLKEWEDHLSKHTIFKDLISDTPPTYVKMEDVVDTSVLDKDDSDEENPDEESPAEPASSSTAGILDVVPETPPTGSRDIIPESPPTATLAKVMPIFEVLLTEHRNFGTAVETAWPIPLVCRCRKSRALLSLQLLIKLTPTWKQRKFLPMRISLDIRLI
jgi:hypothetical protein